MTDNWIIDDTESRQFAQAIETARKISGGRLMIERSGNGLWRIEFGQQMPEADSCTAFFPTIAEAACDAMAASTVTTRTLADPFRGPEKNRATR